MINNININTFKKIAKRNNWVIFDSLERPLDLNIWVIRGNDRNAGTFDDTMVVFWRTDFTNWKFEYFKVTADPSEISLMNNKNELGVAIIKQGQHRGAWALGLHKGQYEALVQIDNITVIRDFNENNFLDIPDCDNLMDWKNVPPYSIKSYKKFNRLVTEYLKNDIVQYRTEVGKDMGINCHRASAWKLLERVGLYSEGCVVHYDPTRYKEVFIPLIKESIKHWGNRFSFIMCHEEQLYY